MKKIKLAVILILVALAVRAQDVIVKNDGNEIKSKVLEIGVKEIKYKRFDYLTGPTVSIAKESVFYIKYENGKKEVFKQTANDETNVAALKDAIQPVVTLVRQINLAGIITKRNGEEIKAQVLEINESDIKYKKTELVNSPVLTINKSSVFYIKYETGKKELFKDETPFIANYNLWPEGIRQSQLEPKQEPYKIRKFKKDGVIVERKHNAHGIFDEEALISEDKVYKIEYNYYESGKLKRETHYSNEQKNGFQKMYYEDGIVSQENIFKNDNLKLTKHYSENGNITMEVPQGNGMFREYYASGSMMSETPLLDHKVNGTKRTYWENGIILSEQSYISNEPQLLVKRYDEKGNLLNENPVSNEEFNDNSKLYDSKGELITSGIENGVQLGYYKTGELWIETPYENGLINGIRIGHYKNKVISMKMPYYENKVSGIVILYDTNGVMLSQSRYTDNVLNGFMKMYNSDGSLISVTPYLDGKQHGVAKTYHKNGMISVQTPYSNGKINGVKKTFYDNGKIQSVQEISNGIGNGVYNFFDIYGNIQIEYIESNGKKNGEQKIYDHGMLSISTIYEDGKKHGVEKIYSKNQLLMETSYIDDKKNGIEKIYSKNQLLMETPFINDEKHGLETVYGNGEIIDKTKYANGVKDIEFEREQEKIWKKQLRQEALREFSTTMVQGLQQVSAQLDFQNNPNSQTLTNYMTVTANNYDTDLSPQDAIKANNAILQTTPAPSINDAYNKSSQNIASVYNNVESSASTDGGQGFNANAAAAKKCAMQAAENWTITSHYKEAKKNPGCSKLALKAELKQAEIFYENCKEYLPPAEIDGFEKTINSLRNQINNTPNCEILIWDAPKSVAPSNNKPNPPTATPASGGGESCYCSIIEFLIKNGTKVHLILKYILMRNKIKWTLFLLLLLIQQLLFSQKNSCNSYTVTGKKVLWSYDTDINKKLFYKINFCTHNGLHQSIIEVTKSDENDTSEIKGELSIDIGYFDQKEEISSINYQKDKVEFTTDVKEKTSRSLVWEKWFAFMRVGIYAKTIPELLFVGSCVTTKAYSVVHKGFPWERYDEENIFPDWFRELMPDVMKYDSKTNMLTYGGKQYDLKAGACELIAVSPLIFQQQWVRDKFWKLLKEHIQEGIQESVEDYYIDRLFKEETAENIKLIKEGVRAGKDLRAFAFFLIKNVTLKNTNAGDAKMEGPDFKFQKQLIAEHPEIKAPASLTFDKQFYFVIYELMVNSIMKSKNVSKSEAERMLKSNPEVSMFINPYYPSAIRQN